MDEDKLFRLKRLASTGPTPNVLLPERIQQFAPWTWDRVDQIAAFIVMLAVSAFVWEVRTQYFSNWVRQFDHR